MIDERSLEHEHRSRRVCKFIDNNEHTRDADIDNMERKDCDEYDAHDTPYGRMRMRLRVMRPRACLPPPQRY